MNGIKEKNTEELLNLLDSDEIEETSSAPEVKPEDDAIMAFIYKWNIKSGNIKVHSGLLYDLFNISFKGQTTQVTFTRFLKKLFPFEKINSITFYYINLNPMEVCGTILKEKTKKTQFRNTKNLPHFQTFLQKAKLEPGKHWVDSLSLYEIYKKVMPKSKMYAWLAYTHFCRLLDVHFDSKRINRKSTAYRVNDVYKQYIPQEVVYERSKGRSGYSPTQEARRSQEEEGRANHEAETQQDEISGSPSGSKSQEPS